jgi:ankyrin repeat protein
MLQYQVATIPNKKSFNSPDYTPLHIQEACRLGDMQEILKAIDLDPDSINCRDQNVIYIQLGWTPLYRSVVSGDFQATQLLLSHGADPNIVNHLGETPLHQAADYSQYAIAKSLLDAGADPDIQQDQGDTPLHHAAFKGDSQMISLLLEYGADPNTKNYMFGRTPVHYAVDYGHIECAEIIVKSGGDIYLPDRVTYI